MNNPQRQGRIVRGVGGWYDVQCNDGSLLRCVAPGRFRQQGQVPLPGDYVTCVSQGTTPPTGRLCAILPRRNQLPRPPLANADALWLVVSTTQPEPNLRLLDLQLALAAVLGIPAMLIFTKCDLRAPTEWLPAYAAFDCISFGGAAEKERLLRRLPNQTVVLCGNTGVGKSTLLNHLAPALQRPTGEISAKLGRGRHTTRTTELFAVAGGFVVDTPGFSSLTAADVPLLLEDLPAAFCEFRPYLGQCRFRDCAHLADAGCAVTAAVQSGAIPASRYASYAILRAAMTEEKSWGKKH